MKTLLLLRHAKSSHDEQGISDFDRPLSDRGRRDAPRVGEVIRDEFPRPERVLSSSAKRAKKTAEKAIEAMGNQADLILVDELYLAPPEAYMKELRHLNDELTCVLMVGHNPGLEELVARLTGQHDQLPTTGLVHIELPIDHWADVALDGSANLVRTWRPKEEG
jgi:phosphohistidine phosphatase